MKFSVLFVDDEINLLRDLQSTISLKKTDWHIYIAENGDEALELLSKHEIDVVAADLRMPQIDGASLLNKIKEKYPRIIRIIYVEMSDKEKILRSTVSAHQILSKPYNIKTFITQAEKTFFIRNYLTDEKLIKIINGLGNLPSLPSLYLQLEEEMRSPDFSLNKIGDIISQDIAMTAKLLQLVNSAYFGLKKKITNIHHAVNYLGLNIIKSFVIYIKVFSSIKLPDSYNFMLEDIWNHSFKVAQIAKNIYSSESSESHGADDAYIAGILHDIGKLILMRGIPEYADKILNSMVENNISYVEAEYDFIGSSHAEVGAYLLGLWDLPFEIIEAVAFHHNPSKLEDDRFTVLSAVHLANAFERFMPHMDLNYLKNLKWSSQLNKIFDMIKSN